jgi:ABC-type nitrate/sulfonate/bicarbonate transport system substrate-binding protein
MSDLKIHVGCSDLDRTRALFDETVRIEGVEARFESAPIVSDLFERMIRDHAFDASEMGLTFYLRTLESDNPSFIAIPVFPNRQFRHSSIFINASSGIEKPEDLAGRTIGELAIYGHDAGIWPKGILSDDYGVKPEQCRWLIGGSDFPIEPYDFVPQNLPAGVDIAPVPRGKLLGPMLEAGEIDAFISAITPQCILDGSPSVARLFPDYEAVERDYYSRTGIFPIMHTVVVRRDLLERHPGLARALYDGFSEAKDLALEKYRKGRMEQHNDISVPWFTALLERNSEQLPEDWWPYGVEANRTALDTFLRYFFEQGLSKRLWTCDDIFAADLLDT